jgi:hypothetical protein
VGHPLLAMSTSSPAADDLVGQHFVASIGEPWDFSSSAGDNRLEGQIHRISPSARGQPVLLCSVSSFKSSSAEIDRVAAVNRYVGAQDVLATLRSGRPVTLNFMFLPMGGTADELLSVLARAESMSLLVGSMTLAKT